MNRQKIVGIDIGGTKVHAGLTQDGKILEEVRFPTSANAPMEQIVAELIEGIKPLIVAGVAGIGIGVPGLVDEKSGTVFDVQNINSFISVSLKKLLEDRFKVPVHLTNDANIFVLGEKFFGKAKPYKNVVGITLGTGLGAGLILNNDLYSGAYSCAGELGGISYLDQTIEDYCSGKFFRNKFRKEGSEVFALAQGGDEKALEVYRQFGEHLGNAIKVVLYSLAPEAIIVGGSGSKGFPFFKEAMEKSVGTFPYQRVVDQLVIFRSEMPDAAVLGAAALFLLRNKD